MEVEAEGKRVSAPFGISMWRAELEWWFPSLSLIPTTGRRMLLLAPPFPADQDDYFRSRIQLAVLEDSRLWFALARLLLCRGTTAVSSSR